MNKKKIIALLLSLILSVSMVASFGVNAATKKTVTGTTIADYAKTLAGKDYKYGATGPDKFDASGFVVYTYKKAAGIDITKKLGRTCQQMYTKSVKLKLTTTATKLKAGDLVFYGSSKNAVKFVGIYLGSNKVMCVSSSKGVTKTAMVGAGGKSMKVIGYASATSILKAYKVSTTTKETEKTTTTPVASTATGKKIASYAKKLKGADYKWGATGPKSFDASGFILYTYKKATGIDIAKKLSARSCQQLYNSAIKNKLTTSSSKLQVGDVVFYGKSSSKVSFAGIYLGSNKVMCVSSSKGVTESSLKTAGGSSLKIIGYASASSIVNKYK